MHSQTLSHTFLINFWIKNFKKIELKLVYFGFGIFLGCFFLVCLVGWWGALVVFSLFLWSFYLFYGWGFFVISPHIPFTSALYLCSTQVLPLNDFEHL